MRINLLFLGIASLAISFMFAYLVGEPDPVTRQIQNAVQGWLVMASGVTGLFGVVALCGGIVEAMDNE